MATYIVTKVRQETSADGTHRHIEGVCTDAGTHYTRKEVVDSITAGNTWKTKSNGYEATITKITYCPEPPAGRRRTPRPTRTAPRWTTLRTCPSAERRGEDVPDLFALTLHGDAASLTADRGAGRPHHGCRAVIGVARPDPATPRSAHRDGVGRREFRRRR